jgi:hypothetical protein
VNPDLEERQTEFVMDRAGVTTVLGVGRNQRHDGDRPRSRGARGGVRGSASLLAAIAAGVPKLAVQIPAQLVTVEQAGRASPFTQLPLDRQRERCLPRPGEAGQPQGSVVAGVS